MKTRSWVLATILLSSLSHSAMAEYESKEKPVIIVVENNDGLKEKGIDPFIANAILGVKDIQEATKKAGILDCNCVMKDGNSYVSFTMGNGKASEGGSLAWRAFSLRIGKQLTDDVSIVFGHLNEGHPYNHHRDGFSLSAAYIKPIGDKFKLEASVGPYFSMDTTEINGIELDDKKLGVVGTIALLYSLDNLVPGLQARLEYNRVLMPGAFTTNSVMFGVGKEFGPNSKKGSGSSSSKSETEVVVIGDIFITNHGDVDTTPKGFQVEAKKKLSNHTAASVGYMKEGVDSRV
ncbi:MAG: hypothetical protein K2Q18_02605, partial [Bdellovibrionales bacterium]|nr:hypothetical protein [Bdellovibrionales bacterium]